MISPCSVGQLHAKNMSITEQAVEITVGHHLWRSVPLSTRFPALKAENYTENTLFHKVISNHYEV